MVTAFRSLTPAEALRISPTAWRPLFAWNFSLVLLTQPIRATRSLLSSPSVPRPSLCLSGTSREIPLAFPMSNRIV
jgi:hypothetical protein